jgi:hypothetical protein
MYAQRKAGCKQGKGAHMILQMSEAVKGILAELCLVVVGGGCWCWCELCRLKRRGEELADRCFLLFGVRPGRWARAARVLAVTSQPPPAEG